MSALTDYPLKSAPTISLGSFQHVLQNAGSPIAGEASAVYAAFTAKGINPAIGLAITQHESSFGKAGIAVGRNNPFGDRYYEGAAAFGAVNKGGWASFPSYAAAASYEASLLAGPKYAGSSNANTARSFAQVYAPSGDGGNNPSGYGSTIVNAVAKWSGGVGAIAAKPSTAAPAKAAAKPSTAAPAKAAPTKAKGAKALASGNLSAYATAHPKTTIGGAAAALALLLL